MARRRKGAVRCATYKEQLEALHGKGAAVVKQLTREQFAREHTDAVRLRPCVDADCKIPHEHEAHDKLYDVNAHLDAVRAVIGERGRTRDLAKGERSMARCVRAFNAITGRDMSAREGWLFMACLKLARMQTGRYKHDDYLDHTGYSTLMAEEARREHEKQEG